MTHLEKAQKNYAEYLKGYKLQMELIKDFPNDIDLKNLKNINWNRMIVLLDVFGNELGEGI